MRYDDSPHATLRNSLFFSPLSNVIFSQIASTIKFSFSRFDISVSWPDANSSAVSASVLMVS